MDRVGLAAAYSSSTGLHREGTTLYIRGTSWSTVGQAARDLWDDAMLPLSNVAGLGGATHTRKMGQVRQALARHPEITMMVGHSLGASVARQAAVEHSLDYRSYNSPSISWTRNDRSRRHFFDPISALDRGATSTAASSMRNVHSYNA